MKTYLLYLICSNHLISLRVQQRGIFKTHVSNKIKRCVFNSRLKRKIFSAVTYSSHTTFYG